MTLALPLVIGLLVAATVVAIAAKRAQVPYNVALVLGGLAISSLQLLPGTVPTLDPEIVFLICLPALLFEGGITADLPSIRANALPISLLSTLGMLLAIGGTGTALHLALALPWGAALLLGAVLSVTDTVSILYAFRRAPVPTRLAGIMEGESLFNDGTALVTFGAIAAVVAGQGMSVPTVAARVLIATAGGMALGLALGFLVDFLLRRTGDPLTEIMATTALALGAYSVAEWLHVSGVIAAVTTGLTVGNSLQRLSPRSRIAISSFWEYAAFGVNTFLFLSVGLITSPTSLVGHAGEVLLAVGCVFAGRALGVYLPFLVLRFTRPAQAVPVRWQHVFVIGNVKGALSIALALGLPATVPLRSLLVDVTFGVTFVSLVGQIFLLGRSLRWLGLTHEDPVADQLGEHQARLLAARAARQELDVLQASGLVPRAGYDVLRGDYQVTIASAERELRGLQERHLAQSARALLHTRRRLVDAERTALMAARRSGLVSEHTTDQLLAEVDARLLTLERVLAGETEEDR